MTQNARDDRAEARMIATDTTSPPPMAPPPRRTAQSEPAPDVREDDGGPGALFPADQVDELRARWAAIQTGLVDEPRQAVKQADELVVAATTRLTEAFAAERGRLEGQWDRGDEVTTEDLRQALRRYRLFFGRLLAI